VLSGTIFKYRKLAAKRKRIQCSSYPLWLEQETRGFRYCNRVFG